MIRILHVLGGLDAGGAETFVMNIYRNIDRNKFQFDFVVHNKDKNFYLDEIKKLGGNVYYVPKYNGYNHFQYIQAWKNFFNEHSEYKIIHSHVRSTASIILRVAKKYGLVTICHSHSTSNGRGLSSFVKKIYQKRIVYYADYLFGCSKEANEWLYGKKYAKKSFVLNNTIDTSKFVYNGETRKRVRKKLGINNKFVLGQVGRLSQVKNHNFSIRLLNEYLKINKDAFLLIIGDGELYSDLSNEIKKQDLSNNILILKNRSDVNELMQAMDVYIMPSLYEGLPLALVEAQTASLPCIISDNVGAGIIINDLVKKLPLNENIDLWIKQLEKCKMNYRTDRTKQIINAGFDVKSNVVWLEKFYQKNWKK